MVMLMVMVLILIPLVFLVILVLLHGLIGIKGFGFHSYYGGLGKVWYSHRPTLLMLMTLRLCLMQHPVIGKEFIIFNSSFNGQSAPQISYPMATMKTVNG